MRALLILSCLFFSLFTLSSAKTEPSRPDFAYPKTVEKNAQKQLTTAIKSNDGANIVRALIDIALAKNEIGSDYLPDAMKQIAEIAEKETKTETKALLKILMARIYNDVYQSKRYVYDQRHLPLHPLPSDWTEWSGKQFQNVIADLCQQALTDKDALISKSIASYSSILTYNNQSRIYYPTLYDFVASQAIEIYKSMIEGNNTLSVNLLTPAQTFSQSEIYVANSPLSKQVLQIYADLLSVHKNTFAPYINYDLQRIEFVFNNIYSSQIHKAKDKTNLLLTELYNKYYDQTEYAGDILFNLNNYCENRKAYFAQIEGFVKRYPAYWRNACLKNIASEITRRIIQVEMPQYCAPGRPITININQSNAKSITIGLYRIPDRIYTSIKQRDIKKSDCILIESKTLKFNSSIPFDTTCTTTLTPPEFGVYAVWTNDDDGENQKLSEDPCIIRCTELGVIQFQYKKQRYITFNPYSGKTVGDVTLTIDDKQMGKTNEDGLYDGSFNIKNYSYIVRPSKGKDQYGISIYGHKESQRISTKRNLQTQIYTDLPLYHQGDSVRWAAIASSYDIGAESRKLEPNVALKVMFRDANYQPIDSTVAITDSSGRIQGCFHVPNDRLTGNYSIMLSLNESNDNQKFAYYANNQTVKVSDYKMPTFRVEVDKPLINIPANGSVTLQGKAITYSGMPLTNTKVVMNLQSGEYQIFRWSFLQNFQEFITDSVTTDENGHFTFIVDKQTIANSPNPDGMFKAVFTATSNSGESQLASTNFNTGKSFSISANIDGASPTSINVSDPINLEYTVYNNDDKISLPIKVNVCKNDTVIYSTSVEESPSKLDLSAIPTGTYTFAFQLADTSLAKNSNALTWNDVAVYRTNDKKSPSNDVIHLLGNDGTLIINNEKQIHLILAVAEDNTNILTTVGADTSLFVQKWIKLDAGVHKIAIDLPDQFKQYRVKLLSYKNYNVGDAEIAIVRNNPNGKIQIRCETFRDKIIPGNDETWKFTIVNADSVQQQASLIMRMYNSALDAIFSQKWHTNFSYTQPRTFSCYTPYLSAITQQLYGRTAHNNRLNDCQTIDLPQFQTYGLTFRHPSYQASSGMVYGVAMSDAALPLYAKQASTARKANGSLREEEAMVEETLVEGDAASGDGINESVEQQDSFDYRDTNTTLAFFRPMISTNEQGQATLTFHVPNVNTTWRLEGLAYTNRLASATIDKTVLANKPIMVSANLPRFVREGDRIILSALVFNNSDSLSEVSSTIEIFNPASGSIFLDKNISSTIEAGKSATVTVEIDIPEAISAIGYRVKSSTDRFADGEQSLIPVLKSFSPVIETQPFYISPDTTRFSIKLFEIGSDADVTLQYCNNPIWYCVTALPGLRSAEISSPIEAASAIFSAATAEGILKSNPKIAEALKKWTESDQSDSTLVSMLQRNSDLKTMLLQATPWVVDAMTDTERMQRLALLFDRNEINKVYDNAISTLNKLQRNGGGWAWYDAAEKASIWSTSQTLYILGWLNRLNYLPENRELTSMVDKALRWHQSETEKDYRKYPNSDYIEYLSVRDLWPQYKPSATGQTIIRRQIQHIVKNWKKYNIAGKASAAVLLYHNGYKQLAISVLNSINQFAISSPEKGLWWPSVADDYSGSLYQLEVAAKTLLAIKEIQPQSTDIDLIRQWLILQKEAQNWGQGSLPSLVITSILTTSSRWIDNNTDTEIKIDSATIPSTYTDKTLGYIKTNISSIAHNGSILHVYKSTSSPSWGAVFSRSIMKIDEIKASSCEAVSIEKKLYLQKGTEWVNADSIKVGDRLKVQLLVHVDRDMQYVAISDERAACFEPVEQLPKPIFAEGICFYRENRNASTNMFVTNLPKGTYLLEYELWANNAGNFASGIATIQSQYAPALSAHSSGTKITVN